MKKGEVMTREEQEQVELIKQKIIDRQDKKEQRKNTSFKDSKVGSIVFKSIHLISMSNKEFFLNRRKKKGILFGEDILSPKEVEEDEASTRNIPVDSYHEEVKPCYTLSSVFPNLEVQNQVMEILRKDRVERIECHKKARFSSYLNVPSEELGQWSWDQIDEHILEKSNAPRGVQKLFYKSKKRK